MSDRPGNGIGVPKQVAPPGAFPGAWANVAACRNSDPDVFFPPGGRTNNVAAVLICRPCPVRVECLEFALENDMDHGVWGGMGQSARVELRRSTTRAAS